MAANPISCWQTSSINNCLEDQSSHLNDESKMNIDKDSTRQTEEIEVIESIYDTEELSSLTLKSHNFLKFNAFLSVPQKLCLSFISSNNNVGTEKNVDDSSSLSVEHLPPIELDIELPTDYPSKSPPIYSVSCIWLSHEDLQSICNHMDSMWSPNTEVLFSWTQFLKTESLNFLQLTDNLCYPIKTQEENVIQDKKEVELVEKLIEKEDKISNETLKENQSIDSHSTISNAELGQGRNIPFNKYKNRSNPKKYGPKLKKGDSLIFYNRKYSDNEIYSDKNCKRSGIVERCSKGSGTESHDFSNFGRGSRKYKRFPKKPYHPNNYEHEIHKNSTDSLVTAMKNNELCDRQVETSVPKTSSIDDSSTDEKRLKVNSKYSKIKKFSENSSEMFLKKYLERYDVERELSEFRKKYFTCSICFEDKFGLSCIQFQPCCHVFCRDCIRGYLQTRILEGSVHMIKCPDIDCDCNILPAQVRELVGPEQYAKYDHILLTTTLDTMPDIIRCPRQDCQYPVTKEPEEKVATCPVCSYAFCVQCRRVYHGVEPCSFKHHEKEALMNEYMNGSEEVKHRMEQKYGKSRLKNLVQTSLSEKWIDDNSKNCCSCNASIEKSEGCNKIVCWRCNTFFCWNCLSRLDAKAPYAHYYNRNSPCYNKLFEGTPNDEDDDVFVLHDFDEDDDDEEEEEDEDAVDGLI